jgi:hypothetical protein
MTQAGLELAREKEDQGAEYEFQMELDTLLGRYTPSMHDMQYEAAMDQYMEESVTSQQQ